ncbi:MAG: hypothetical protein IJT68_03420 [Lentisphaeria bacterium]|nr:hypothetical protein [Lentisphaeria bacterium]
MWESAEQKLTEVQPGFQVRTPRQKSVRTFAFRRVEVFAQVDVHFELNAAVVMFSEDKYTTSFTKRQGQIRPNPENSPKKGRGQKNKTDLHKKTAISPRQKT